MDRSSRSGSSAQQQQQLEDDDDVRVPVEVLQNIQSRLPVKAAGRTSVLSKSWLHAWSTIPALRFHHYHTLIMMELADMDRDPTLMKLVEDMDRTLMRYLRDNIPIETFELIIEFEDQDLACLVEKWILLLATKTRVKELSIRLGLQDPFCEGVSLNLPHEILSSENLTKLIVITNVSGLTPNSARMTSSNPVIITCVSLRELHLNGLHISQNILDAILSSCSSSLEKVRLSGCCSEYLKTIKVKNLPCLYELSIFTNDDDLYYSSDFEISHLPNLRFFRLIVHRRCYIHHSFDAHLISLAMGSSGLTQLTLEGVIMDTTSLGWIKSGFPFLESLSLDMSYWRVGSFHFARASLKSVSLLYCPSTLVDVQIHAPKLRYFRFESFDDNALPTTLLFPISTTLDQLNLRLQIDMGAVDASFFLRMREALTLSTKCHLHIEIYFYRQPLDIDIKDLRTRLRLPPATNVQELCFETEGDECRWQRSPFFDAFFEICHPNEVVALTDFDSPHKNHFRRVMLMEFLKNRYKNKTQTQTVYWPYYLEHVRFKVDRYESWKTLTKSRRRLVYSPATYYGMYFKLKWRKLLVNDRSSLLNLLVWLNYLFY